MSFVYEVVPEKDRELWLSFGINDVMEERLLPFFSGRKWCADRERNAFLIGVGGDCYGIPLTYDLWWNGNVIRMEVDVGVKDAKKMVKDVVWAINKIPVPEHLWEKRSELMKIIIDAFSVNITHRNPKDVNSVTVKIMCEPECIVEDR